MKRYVLVFVSLICLKGVAQFTPGNIVVSRTGDGLIALSNQSTQIDIIEYTTSGVQVGSVLSLPTAVSGLNRAITIRGTAQSEGLLNLSNDGRFITITGYDIAPGTANPHNNSNNTINRVIGRIDNLKSVVTSTYFTNIPASGGFAQDAFRNAITDDGNQYWCAGNSGSTPASGGIRYITHSTAGGAGVAISNTTNNTRTVAIFNDSLYSNSFSFPIQNVSRVGDNTVGLPITSGWAINVLPGLTPAINNGGYGFLIVDLPAGKLLYVADQNTNANGGGLKKYSLVANTWVLNGTIGNIPSGSTGLTQVIGKRVCGSNTDVLLYCLTAPSSTMAGNNLLLSVVDNTGYNSDPSTLTFNTILSAGNNYAFKGLSFAPTDGGFITGTQNITAGNYNVITVKSGGIATLTGNITVFDRIVVENGGVLEMGNSIISSPTGIGSRFEVQSGGTIKIGSADGITASAALGNVQTCFRKFDAGANYEYYANAVQVTGDGIPSNLTGTLKINNSAGLPSSGVTLSQATSISGTLDLTLGKLTTTAAQLLTMNNTSALINAGVSSFINGPIKKVGNDASFIFPVGKGSIYAPLDISGGSGGAAADEFTAEYVRGNPQSTTGSCPTYCQPDIDHVSFVEYWTLERNAGTASKIITLDVHATSFCAEINNTYISQWDPSAPNKWSKELSSSVLTGTIGVLELGTVTTISPITAFAANRFFTLGTDRPFVNNPLPVKLLDFTAKKYSEQAALIEWELSDNCFAATKFELERSTDKETFTVVAVLPGKENSRLYFHNDTRLAKGTNWYRLKITEVDGKVTYSKVIAIINDTKGLLITSVLPNPVSNTATITLSTARSGMADILLHDISGTVVYRRRSAIAEGTNYLPVEMGKLPAGVYHLAVQTVDSKAVYRLVKQ